ncbi:family 43 glycosylhydrolase [Streptomyces sp. NPDC049881]|uniref:family 43 glycosylhydrolase n=1 Tax=Streptomyces sp. NPDC049881 TaxID=3155778 RepID=UPI0034493510
MRRLRALAVALSAAVLFTLSPAASAADGPAVPPVVTTAEAGNPIADGWYADPDVAVYGDRYWVFPTTSRSYSEQTFLDAFSSTDLVNWTKHPRVLETANISWARYALWAPAPIQRNGRYYLYFAANDIQNNSQLGGIGVAVADRPEGPYRDAIGRPLIAQFHNGAQPIDQDVFIDDDGQAYMYYGGWSHANVVKLNPDMTSLGTFADGSTYREITPSGYTEGPQMFKRGGRYYLMWSEGGWTGPDYSVSYAIADSPTGPFTRLDSVLVQDAAVARGSGHNSVINVPGTDIWYIVYHRRPLSETDGNHRALAYDRMYFNEDGTIRPVTMKVQDDFADGNSLGWRTHGTGQWSVNGGAYGVGSATTALAVQDTAFSSLVQEADVRLTDAGSEAGLAFRVTRPGTGPDGYHGYYAALRPDGVVLSRVGDSRTQLAAAALDIGVGTTHRLKVEATGSTLKVYVDDMRTPRLQATDTTHTSGANGLRASRSAVFDNFSVRSNVFSLEASDQPNRFVRHEWSRGRIDPDITPFADMQWRVVPGLADPAAVSLESVNFPGHYLRHRFGEVWMDRATDDSLFRADATWRIRPGLADPALTSFESWNFPGEYLRHRDSLLWKETITNTPQNRANATFRMW